MIDQQMVYRLTPHILSLQSTSRDPLTVYIDSPGGVVGYKETLLNLLCASTQDIDPPCRLITVVTATAASAAADLLSFGDYALAYQDATILYHGVRIPGHEPITAEDSSLLAQYLRADNNTSAMELVRCVEFRFMFRFITCKADFDNIRQRYKGEMDDLDCFVALITENISESAKKVLDNAHQRYHRYRELLESVFKNSQQKSQHKSRAEKEALEIKAIVDFELENNKENKNWSFTTGGIHCLTDDFLLLKEYLSTFQEERFSNLCVNWGSFLLSDEENGKIEKLSEDERRKKKIESVRSQLLPVWSFLVALCHSLQQGENILSAKDAFWLGLIDEVIGEDNLPTYRLIAEYKPDQKDQDTTTGD